MSAARDKPRPEPGSSDRPPSGRRPEPLGFLLGAAALAGLLVLSFVDVKASRIASGHGLALVAALPPARGALAAAWLALVATAAPFVRAPRARLLAALGGLLVLALALGAAADFLTPAGNRTVRIAPGAGFWLMALAFALLAVDAIARLKPRALARVAWLGVAAIVIGAVLRSGLFDHLSIMREYAVNASTFSREARTHLALALGSTLAALAVGLPLGLLCHRRPALRGAVLQLLNLVQTIPSIALFGLLMVPLGWLATAVPVVGEFGIHGIGPAPAAIALFLYALLPIVANTVRGLGGVPPATVEAARGMGLRVGQVLARVEIPLAAPVILTGVRVVLVQNIGLATIAALIGGGGFGTFVFQGIGQTAIDLVLLGAIPTVALAFATAVVLDALVDLLKGVPR
jgi:osmoprotectant transport system permease protein